MNAWDYATPEERARVAEIDAEKAKGAELTRERQRIWDRCRKRMEKVK